MNKLDIRKEYESYYKANKYPEVVEISEASYVSILGNGSPGTDDFYEKKKELKVLLEGIEKRYSETEKSFTSTVVEIFYWYDEQQTGFVNIGEFYTKVDLNLLHYRIAIRIPKYVSEKDIRDVAQESLSKKFATRFEHFTYTAGKSVQLLHLGPFAGELKTLPVLQDFASEKGLIKSGMHHEIHLVNFEPGQSQAHLQTILRDPVTKIID